MNREGALKIVLILVGLIFLVAVCPLMMFLWPSGWRWQPNQPEYEQMILGVYATLGIFLLLASRNPQAHRSLIAFTAWSSLVHAGIMAVQAFQNAGEHGHLLGGASTATLQWHSPHIERAALFTEVINGTFVWCPDRISVFSL